MATKKSKKPAKKRQPRISIAERYMVATDAIEESGAKNIAAARKIVTELRALYPDYPVPTLAREVIPFDAPEVIEDVARAVLMTEHGITTTQARKKGSVLDADEVANLMDHLSIADSSDLYFNITGDKSGNEWHVVQNEEIAEALALDGVKQDLRDEPGMFNADFIARHIDQEKLKKYVYDSHMGDDYISELPDEYFWGMADQFGVSYDEDDKDREKIEEDVKEAYANDAAKNPEEFFRDIYGDEATKYMIEAAGIDIDAAAQAAIDEDGWQRYISSYDGNSYETSAGFVFWRTN